MEEARFQVLRVSRKVLKDERAISIFLWFTEANVNGTEDRGEGFFLLSVLCSRRRLADRKISCELFERSLSEIK